MPVVNFTCVKSDGSLLENANFTITLMRPLVASRTRTPVFSDALDGSGFYGATLEAGRYSFSIGQDVIYFNVPAAGGPYTLNSLLETT